MLSVVCVGGSLREGSHTNQVLRETLPLIEEEGAQGSLLNIRELTLPFCDGRDEYPDFPDVEHLRSRLYSADAILFATPEYHGSLSGVLKNILDLLEDQPMRGKVVGLISVLGGGRSSNALNTLRVVCRQMGMWAVPSQMVLPNASQAFNESGHLASGGDQERLQVLVKELIRTARQLRREVEPEQIF